MTQAKRKGLAAQSNQIETTLAKLNSCLHFMRESLRTGNESDVLMMKANTVQQVKELTTPFQQDVLKVIIFKFCTLTSLSPAPLKRKAVARDSSTSHKGYPVTALGMCM